MQKFSTIDPIDTRALRQFAESQERNLESCVSLELMHQAVRLSCGHAIDRGDVEALKRLGISTCPCCTHALSARDSFEPCYTTRRAASRHASLLAYGAAQAPVAALSAYFKSCAEAELPADLSYRPPSASPLPGAHIELSASMRDMPEHMIEAFGDFFPPAREVLALTSPPAPAPPKAQRLSAHTSLFAPTAVSSAQSSAGTHRGTQGVSQARPPPRSPLPCPVVLPLRTPTPRSASGAAHGAQTPLAVGSQAATQTPGARLQRGFFPLLRPLQQARPFLFLSQQAQMLCAALDAAPAPIGQICADRALDMCRDLIEKSGYVRVFARVLTLLTELRRTDDVQHCVCARGLLNFCRQLLRTLPSPVDRTDKDRLYRLLDRLLLGQSSPVGPGSVRA